MQCYRQLSKFGVEGTLSEHEQTASSSHFERSSDGNSPLVQPVCQSVSVASQSVDNASIEAAQSEVQQYLIPWLIDSVSVVIKYRLNTLLLRDAICQPSAEEKEKFDSCSSPRSVKKDPPV
ncbi:hypothetical protein D918_01976 [Trichuris suis]|nr:hypothetical protein D918_01976 [Trichuris suis]